MFLALATALLVSPPASGRELVQQMHDRYAGRWYASLTFVQTTTFADGHQETWYEAASIPGKLRIDIAPLDQHQTILFRNDSVYQWRAGQRQGGPFVHPLMVLGFDVYAQPVERTVEQLTTLGYDLSRIHADTWQGRPVWVVGADAGDSTTRQFWVDQERLVFVRLREPARRDPGKTSEIRFDRYQRLGEGWIAAEVQMWNGGAFVMKEEYADIRTDLTLPEELWEAGTRVEPHWME